MSNATRIRNNSKLLSVFFKMKIISSYSLSFKLIHYRYYMSIAAPHTRLNPWPPVMSIISNTHTNVSKQTSLINNTGCFEKKSLFYIYHYYTIWNNTELLKKLHLFFVKDRPPPQQHTYFLCACKST